MQTTTWLGRAASLLLAPVTGGIAWLRAARMLHPVGVVVRAEVIPEPGLDPQLAAVADRLAGPALVRLSNAWWKHREWPDALGVAVRLRSSASPPSVRPEPGDQDLLFATIRRPFLLPIDPLRTDVHDFLANDFYGTSPFRVLGVGRARLRLRPVRSRDVLEGDRDARLARAIEAGDASFALEAKRFGRPWRRIVRIELGEEIDLDQEELRFSPFRDGRGITPVGFVHGLRAATYAASRAASRRARGRRARRAELG